MDIAAPEGSSGEGGARPSSKLVNDEYEFGDTLGSGGFAVVRLATKKSTGKQVAMKIMNLPKSQKRQNERDDIFYEVGLLAKLDSEYIIRLDEFFVEDNKVYLATELLAGGDLLDAVIAAGRYDEFTAMRIFQRVLLGMKYLHQVGITHRDMKLENLLLGSETDLNTVKICDLGLAKKATERLMKAVCGTPQYVSPEVVNAKPGDAFGAEVDNWACGVILFILLGGYPPFANADEDKLYEQIKVGKFSFKQSKVWEVISEEAKDLVKAFLRVDPGGRMTAETALNHPWFKKTESSETPAPSLAETQVELKKNFRRMFKGAVSAVRSTLRASNIVRSASLRVNSLEIGRPAKEESMNMGARISSVDHAVEVDPAFLETLGATDAERESLEKKASTYTQFGKKEEETDGDGGGGGGGS